MRLRDAVAYDEDARCLTFKKKVETQYCVSTNYQLLMVNCSLAGASWINLQGFAEAFNGFLEVGNVEAVADAHLVNALAFLGIETCGGSEHYRCAIIAEIFKQPAAEAVGVVNR